MCMPSCFCTAAIVLVISIGITVPSSASSKLVGTDAIEHCGNTDELAISCYDYEAIQLRFATATGQSTLQIDFVLRGRNLPNEHRRVEIFLTSRPRSGRVPSRFAFRTDRRLYPLATNIDSRGIAKSVVSFDDFMNLAMMSTLEGVAFGEDFVATNQQMVVLRLAVGRWAGYTTTAN